MRVKYKYVVEARCGKHRSSDDEIFRSDFYSDYSDCFKELEKSNGCYLFQDFRWIQNKYIEAYDKNDRYLYYISTRDYYNVLPRCFQ